MNRIIRLTATSIVAGLIVPRCNAAATSPSQNFAPRVSYTTGVGANSVVSGDFNDDGRVDLATANQWANTVSVLHGQPNGTFPNRTDVAVGSRPSFLSTADLNGDGHADLVVSNATDSTFTVLLQSAGNLIRGGNYAVGGFANNLIAKDFNGDGHPDVAVNISNAISLHYGNGDGTFDAGRNLAIDSVGYDILADFNRDGFPDLLTTLPNEGSMINVLSGLPAGGFGNRVAFTFAADRPGFATAADFNRDGILDLAYAGYSGAGSMVVLTGLNNGGFQLKNSYLEPSTPTSITSADFNRDGFPDVVLGDGTALWFYYGLGDGNFAAGQKVQIGNNMLYLSAVDLNADGRIDLVAASGDTGSGQVYVFLNTIPEPSSIVMLIPLAAFTLLRLRVCRRSTQH